MINSDKKTIHTLKELEEWAKEKRHECAKNLKIHNAYYDRLLVWDEIIAALNAKQQQLKLWN